MTAAQAAFPGVLIQFEDFANHNAFRLLDQYRDRACVFNDDIQGTAAVALAGILSGAAHHRRQRSRDQKILFLGAGEAATGIADLVVSAMVAEGLDEADARAALLAGRLRAALSSGQPRPTSPSTRRRYAHEHRAVGDFLTAVRSLKPTAIIGVAAVGGTSRADVLRAMAEINTAADRVRALQSDLEVGMHRRGSLPPHRRQRAVRVRQPVRSR